MSKIMVQRPVWRITACHRGQAEITFSWLVVDDEGEMSLDYWSRRYPKLRILQIEIILDHVSVSNLPF